MSRWLREMYKDTRCLVFHWHRVRDSYANTCVTCGRDWG